MAAFYKYYNIRSKLSGYVLDISGDVADVGVPVVLWEAGIDKTNQLWRFDDATKTIRSQQANDYFVLDISDDDGLIVNAYDSTRANQRWKRDVDTILNVDDPRFCLDVLDSNREMGAQVIKYAFYGTENQFWEVVAPPRKEFYIVSQMHGKAVTVNASGYLEIQPKATPADKNQLFFADHNGYLHSATNDLALTSIRGDPFSLSALSADPSTQWKFKDNQVTNPEGSVLDIEGSNKGDGVKVDSWDNFDAVNQKFDLVYV